jgi:DNA replication protein DnaC
MEKEMMKIEIGDTIAKPSQFTPQRTRETWERRIGKFPSRMTSGSRAHLPRDAAAFVDSINETRLLLLDDGIGSIIAGETGLGKTRAAVSLASAYVASRWAVPAFVSAVAIRSKAFSDWAAADQIITDASKAGILVLDDVGKGTPSTVVDDILFAIIDARSNAFRPTIITTQYGPEDLVGRFKDATNAAAIMRRIMEFSDPEVFSK